MNKSLCLIGLSAAIASAALCQMAANKPAFDIADVHVNPRSVWVNVLANNLQGGFLRGDR